MEEEGRVAQGETLLKEGSQGSIVSALPSVAFAGWEAYRPYLEAFIEGEADPATTAPEKTAQILEKMTGSGSFSWCTLFLAPVYWGWRRCYREAAVYTCCILLLLPVAWLTGLGLLMTGLEIGAGFAFYPLYRKRAMRVYEQAYAAHGNDREAMVGAMRAAGGTSWKGLWLTMALYLAATCILLAIFLPIITWLYTA